MKNIFSTGMKMKAELFSKKFLLKITLLIFFFALTKTTDASHMIGADLKYECLANDTIQFTLNFYRDCNGLPAIANQYTINIESVTGGIYSSCIVYLDPFVAEVSPLCPLMISQSSCNGGTLPGVEKYVYRGKFYLPQPCSDYLFYWEDCCRNGIITNVNLPGSTGLRIEATWNKMLAGCNDSPSFSSLPVPYICQGQLINYNQGGFDANGDSLVYSLVTPLSNIGTAGFTPFQYNTPFSATYPLTTSSGSMLFDSATGQITLNALNTEVTCVAIRIDEFRYGVLIGSVIRDVQLVVLNCTNVSPEQALGNFENLQGATIVGANTIEVCPGSNMSFDFYGHDPDNNTLTLYSNISTVLAGSTSAITQFTTDSAEIHLAWSPSISDTGNYVVTVTLTDDACPVYGQTTYSFVVRVISQTDAGPDLAICASNTNVQLIVTGGSAFSWSPSYGLSDSTIFNPVANPVVTTTYYVQSNLSSLCKNRDTVIVNVIPAVTVNAIANPDTVCAGSAVNLFSGIAGGSGSGFSALWSSSDGSFNSNQLNPVANPLASVNYFVVGSNLNCSESDTVTVTVNPLPPVLVITASGPTTFCQSGTVTLAGNTAGGIWNAGGVTDSSVIVSTAGDYYVTTSNVCGTTTSNYITVTIDQPLVPAVISANGPTIFCDADSLLLSGNTTNGTWSVVGGNTSTILTNVSGNYFVTTQNSCGDTLSNVISVTVLPTPFFALQPSNVIVGTGYMAQFFAVSSISGSALQWQMNDGSGFISLTNGTQFSGVNTNTLTINSVTANQNNYSFRCIATSGSCSDTSDSAFLLIATGIKTIDDKNIFIVYPNPSNGLITIQIINQDSFNQLKIEDVLGRMVYKREVGNENVFNLSLLELAKGVYTVHLVGKNNVASKTIVIE